MAAPEHHNSPPVPAGLAITAVRVPPPGSLAGHAAVGGSASGPDDDFRTCHALREKQELALWGNLDRCPTLAEAAEFWRGNAYEDRFLFLARLGHETAGLCSVTLPLRENTATAGVDVLVAPAYRRRGLGRVLLRHVEDLARSRGRTSLDGYFEVPIGHAATGATVPAKSGAGALPLAEPGTAFALASGYDLEQVERSSSLALPVPGDVLDQLAARATGTSGDYTLVWWDSSCPADLVDKFAELKAHMSVDVPTAGLDWGLEDWDAARVRSGEEQLARSGTEAVVVAAQHRGTGDLVGYTVLEWRPGVPASILQNDTLVVAAHRGHNLGLLLKLANVRRAQERWPAARSVLTWNASENQHMLAINGALGFKPAGYEGEWQKRLG
ncbi:GNAT family acetyltransferase [Arthrobacter sp. ZBG10]|uniref:GNAT family N-acetyltransferase n=1 Tax=Arthrobacter sp. ZBG10 TaxID=1676590 RepID=UPI0006804967|nr:GNAT family N-acetyltransferase [Arthrobacter sp. ZBG10]KNH20098.1 GNAT family acetyltransferase [Arthrobacter sp. ZBG10]